MNIVRLSLCSLVLWAITAFAQDYDTLIKQALRQRDQGHMPAAEQILRQAQTLAKDKSEVSYLLGMVLAFQQKYPEALAVINTALKSSPDNFELRLGKATVLSYQGAYQEADTITNALLAQQPNNTEALTLAGRIAYYQKRPAAAQLRFNQALAIDGNNLDAMLGLYDSYLQSGQSDKAKAWLERAARYAPNHIDVKSRQQPEQYNAQPHHQISAGYGRSSIDQSGINPWHDRFVEYRHLQADGNQQYVRVEHNNRFDTHDTQYEAGLALQQKSSVPVEVAVGVTPNEKFMPHWFGRLQANTPLTDGSSDFGTVILNGLAQVSSYANGRTKRAQIGLDYYLPHTDMWLTPSIGMVRDQDGLDTFAWGLGGHWQLSGTSRIGVTYSDAPETENLITTDSKNSSVYWRQNLGQAWVLYLTWSQFKRENSYTRRSGDATLQYSF
jgi:YaiO family outer membrane protein